MPINTLSKKERKGRGKQSTESVSSQFKKENPNRLARISFLKGTQITFNILNKGFAKNNAH